MAYRDEDIMLDQIYEKKYFRTFIMKIQNIKWDRENAYLKKYSTIQQGTFVLGFSATRILVCIFV